MRIEARRIEKVILVNARNHGVVSQFTLLDPMVPESLGIIGAQLKELGCEVIWIDEAIDNLTPNSNLWRLVQEADLFGVSAMTHTEERAIELAKQAKAVNNDIVCIAGGPGPTSNPEKALKGFDFVVMAQGLNTIIDLCQLLRNGGPAETIQGIAFREQGEAIFTESREFISSLTGVPFADFKLLHNRHRVNIPVITNSLGCPFNCTFCYKNAMCGNGYYLRDVDEAVDYLQYTYQFTRPLWWTGGRRVIFIADDNCAANQKWAIQFFEKIAHLDYRNLFLGVQMRAQACKSQELMDAVKDANVDRIYFGFESPFDEDLKSIRKRQTQEDIVLAIEECKKRSIGIGAMMIWGLENHRFGDHLKYVDFLLKHGVDVMILFMFTPLPQTEDWKRIQQAGLILENVPTRYYDLQHIVFRHPNMEPEEVQRAHLEAISKFYSLRQAISDARNNNVSFQNFFYRLVGRWYQKAAKRQADNYIKTYLS